MINWIKKRFSKDTSQPETIVMGAKDARVDAAGNAVIRPGVRVIGFRAYENNKDLRCAVLPKSVKEVKFAAFRDCPDLEMLVLNEGLEVIEGNTFSGCPKLTELVFPDSIQKVEAYTFYDTRLQKPVFNRSRTALHHYPNTCTEKVYAVPKGIKRLFAGAFFDNTELEEVILPEGLEKIDARAFLDTKIKKITIPSTVKLVEPRAFWSCGNLEEIHFACPESAFADEAFMGGKNRKFYKQGVEIDYDEALRITGHTRLGVVQRLKVPKGDFWKQEPFLTCAKRCSQRETEAMMEFATYFEGLGDDPFYKYAANFWHYRAYKLGNSRAAQWKHKIDAMYPRQPIPSVLTEKLSYGADGTILRALGFLYFEPDRYYSIDGLDANGVVQADSWCGDDGPDEDGFGREEYYDWWLLDDTLNPIPDIKRWHSYSRREMRDREEEWNALRQKAGQIVKNRGNKEVANGSSH